MSKLKVDNFYQFLYFYILIYHDKEKIKVISWKLNKSLDILELEKIKEKNSRNKFKNKI